MVPVAKSCADMETMKIKEMALKIKQNISKVIVGKDEIIDLSLIALITSGHILLEDVPGMGKTLLAKTLAKSLNCLFFQIFSWQMRSIELLPELNQAFWNVWRKDR